MSEKEKYELDGWTKKAIERFAGKLILISAKEQEERGEKSYDEALRDAVDLPKYIQIGKGMKSGYSIIEAPRWLLREKIRDLADKQGSFFGGIFAEYSGDGFLISQIEKETEKAVFVKAVDSSVFDPETFEKEAISMWLPKSQIKIVK